MRPVATTITETNNLDGEEVKFGIGKGQEAWVMRSMADLYSNRELACAREYSTNAYDSNKEKALRDGHDIEPIKVYLPNAMNPYFEVSDSGVGMSRQELAEVYTQFGDSTKRDSDEFNGMLGFGSKAAIAYSNTFTVTSVKNGKKNVGVVTRREDAMGGYLVTLRFVIDDISTNEPSGVSIKIPVHNWREFEQKANDFYRFWMPGTVLVNGREPEWAVGQKIDDGLFYYPHAQGQNLSYVVMGNVPYRIINSDALFPRGMNKISFVAYVPLGTVEFTPSREDLKYSEHTKTNLRKIITDFVDKSVQTAKNEISAATTHPDAYKAWVKWRRVIGSGQVDDLTFKGDKLVDNFPIAGDRWDTSSYRYTTWGVKSWSVSDMEQTLIVSNFDINLASAHKKKVSAWMKQEKRERQYVLFTSEKTVSSPWVHPDSVVSWEKVKAEAPKDPKKPRAQNVAWGRKAGSFDLITKNGRVAEQDVPNDKELFFVMVKDYNIKQDLHNVLREFNLDHKVVLVPANRKDKFLRFYPHAKEILPVLRKDIVLDGVSLLSPEAKLYLSTMHRDRMIIASLDENKVIDPELKAMIVVFKKTEEELTKEYSKNMRLANVLGVGKDFKKHPWTNQWDAKGMPFSLKYPLVTQGVSTCRNSSEERKMNAHKYHYINAVYSARKDGSLSV